MKGKLLRQNVFAAILLGLALFGIACFEIYLNFSADQFKLSLSDWFEKFVPLLIKSMASSTIVLVPITFSSLFANILNVKIMTSAFIFLNRVSFFLIGSYLIYMSSILLLLPDFSFNLEEIPLQLKSFSLNLQLYMFSIPLFFFLLSLLIFRRPAKKQKRKIIELIGLIFILSFSIYEILNPRLTKANRGKLRTLIDTIRVSNDPREVDTLPTDYKESFKSYLGLESIYEREENYIRLLTRRTSKKSKELNVILFYVDELGIQNLKDSIEEKLYTFKKVLKSDSDPRKALDIIKLNLPFRQKDRSHDPSKISTYFDHALKGYQINLYDEVERLSLKKELSFNIIKLNSFNQVDYEFINQIIKKNKKNTVFVFISHKSSGVTEKKIPMIDYSFISFILPESNRPIHFDENKIIGHEDVMTSIYNQVLNDRDYLSLGDDIFSNSNSNAINGSIYIDQKGFIRSGEYIGISDDILVSKEEIESTKERSKSIRDISHFILLKK